MVHEHRKREVKDPLIRKQEILNQAMVLFTRQGYENTSMRDIAKSLHISLGLCYRYFDSKQVLFNEAIDQYVKKCTDMFIHVFENTNKDFFEKMEVIYKLMMSEDDIFSYHEFFHQPQNQDLHHELTLRICQKVVPIITQELERYCQEKNLRIKNINLLVQFLTYGQIGFISHPNMPLEEALQCIRRYISVLIKSEMVPD